MNMPLLEIGLQYYSKKLPQALAKTRTDNLGRVFSEHKTTWGLITEAGATQGLVLTTMRRQSTPGQLPKVGDWVEFDKISGEDKVKIIKVLPRYSTLSRYQAKHGQEQVIAANIDTMFLVLGLDQPLNAMQLNRYLAIAQNGGVVPVVVINKTDAGRGAQKVELEIRNIHPKLNIIATSAKTKIGLHKLESTIPSGHTAVLVGNSGAGKSSLVNALLSGARQATKKVGTDGRGRHTTTSREMFVLPSGGIIIDTPGMRTLELSGTVSDGGIFRELEQLSRQCKFRNCDHVKSAGCALQRALAEHSISQKQFSQFLALDAGHVPRPSYNKSRK